MRTLALIALVVFSGCAHLFVGDSMDTAREKVSPYAVLTQGEFVTWKYIDKGGKDCEVRFKDGKVAHRAICRPTDMSVRVDANRAAAAMAWAASQPVSAHCTSRTYMGTTYTDCQ